MSDVKEPTGAATAEQIALWKKEKNVETIQFCKAELEGEQVIGYFVKPNRTVIAACMKKAKDNKGVMDNFKFLDLIRQNVWLGGDKRFLTDERLKNGFDAKIDTLLEEVDVELGEL